MPVNVNPLAESGSSLSTQNESFVLSDSEMIVDNDKKRHIWANSGSIRGFNSDNPFAQSMASLFSLEPEERSSEFDNAFSDLNLSPDVVEGLMEFFQNFQDEIEQLQYTVDELNCTLIEKERMIGLKESEANGNAESFYKKEMIKWRAQLQEKDFMISDLKDDLDVSRSRGDTLQVDYQATTNAETQKNMDILKLEEEVRFFKGLLEEEQNRHVELKNENTAILESELAEERGKIGLLITQFEILRARLDAQKQANAQHKAAMQYAEEVTEMHKKEFEDFLEKYEKTTQMNEEYKSRQRQMKKEMKEKSDLIEDLKLKGLENENHDLEILKSVNKIYEQSDFDDDGKTSAFAILSLPPQPSCRRTDSADQVVAGMGTYEEPNLLEEMNNSEEGDVTFFPEYKTFGNLFLTPDAPDFEDISQSSYQSPENSRENTPRKSRKHSRNVSAFSSTSHGTIRDLQRQLSTYFKSEMDYSKSMTLNPNVSEAGNLSGIWRGPTSRQNHRSTFLQMTDEVALKLKKKHLKNMTFPPSQTKAMYNIVLEKDINMEKWPMFIENELRELYGLASVVKVEYSCCLGFLSCCLVVPEIDE